MWIENVVVDVMSPRQQDESLDLLSNEILHLEFGDLGDDAAEYLKEMLNRLPGLRDELHELDATQPVLTIDATGKLPPDLLERARNSVAGPCAGGIDAPDRPRAQQLRKLQV